jgi:hypothetical protein
MPGSIVASAVFGLVQGTIAYAATAFAVNLVASQVVSRLIMKNNSSTGADQQQGPQGVRIQLDPATNNKLPIIYGSAWANPIITDAILSEDTKTMWYVMSFSEATDSGTVKFNKLYWGDKQIVLDPNSPNEITGFYDEKTEELDTKPAGKIQLYFYRDGSTTLGTEYLVNSTGTTYLSETNTAISVLSDVGILEADRWTATNLMSDTVFVILKMTYDQNAGLTGLGRITANISNSLKQPGNVLFDYWTNTRYGCAVPSANIDTDSLADLNVYANQIITVTDSQTTATSTSTRFEINGILDVSQNCLDNLVTIADSSDCWVQWNEKNGQWAIKINQSLAEAGLTPSSPRVISTASIIGGINVSPLDLNQSYNRFKVEFYNKDLRDQNDYRYYELDANLQSPNEAVNEMNISLPMCNNSIQADYIGRRRLFQSREDYIINFTMDYSGIQVDAGDIIVVQHDWYSWNRGVYGNETYEGKPFRVTQVKEQKDADGFLSVQISASSYNDTVYTAALDDHTFSKATFGNLVDPNIISKPAAPTFPTQFINTSESTYVVQGQLPSQGNVLAMEFWYSTKGSALTDANQFILYTTQNYNDNSYYPNTFCADYPGGPETPYYEQIKAIALPSGTYYWRTRAVGSNTKSDYSDSSQPFLWNSLGPPTSGVQIQDNSLGGVKVKQADTQLVGKNSGGFIDTLGGTEIAALGAAALYAGYKRGWFDELAPQGETVYGGGNTGGIQDEVETDTWIESTGDPNNPQTGDVLTVVSDVTPNPGSIENNANWDDYDVPPFESTGGGGGKWAGDFDFEQV